MSDELLKTISDTDNEKIKNGYHISVMKVTKIRLVKNYFKILNKKGKYALCMFNEKRKFPYMLYDVNCEIINQIRIATLHLFLKDNLDFKELSNILKDKHKSLYFLRVFDENNKLKYIFFSNSPSFVADKKCFISVDEKDLNDKSLIDIIAEMD